MEATPEAAFAALAVPLLAEPGVGKGTGFGANPGLNVNGGIFAFLARGELVVKLPPERCAQLVADGQGEPFTVGKRAMREWVALPAGDWPALAAEALAFVRATPSNTSR
jgi:hypothetical protein